MVKNITESDGTIKTIQITSNDNHTINLTKKYKLDKKIQENKIVTAYKNSIFGIDIGINSEGFTTIAILSTLIAIGTICIMYAMFKI